MIATRDQIKAVPRDTPQNDSEFIFVDLLFSYNRKVKRHLLKLKPNKSPGPDHIAPCILKSCALELAPSLTHMVNKSFSVGLLPDEWKHADITPLHKKGSKSLRENYRPISLTSISCKIGEKIVFDRMMKFWREIDLINNNQFGFLRGRSTATQLLSTFNDWAKSRNLSIPTRMSSFLILLKPLTAFLISDCF